MSCLEVSYKYSYFDEDFSTGRKVAATSAVIIALAAGILLALALTTDWLPMVNSTYPLIGIGVGAPLLLVAGIALAGCKERDIGLEEAQKLLG